MRLTQHQCQVLKSAVFDVLGPGIEKSTEIRLFGSRVDDSAKGGDIDILISVVNDIEKPASVMAKITAKAMMKLQGQKIDILLEAPNLEILPIHEIAHKKGVLI